MGIEGALVGQNLLVKVRLTHRLHAPVQEASLTPTQIGEMLQNKLSARKVNLLLEKLGYQVKNGDLWLPTPSGEKYSEFLDAGRMSEMLNDNLQKAEKVLKGVIVDINTLTDLCERLAIRITQDKQVYGINNRMANDIAQAVSLVANEVSFFTSLMVMGEQAVGVLENLVKKM